MTDMKTDRLYIRTIRTDDWADLYEMLSDERVVQYEPYSTHTEEECKEAAEYRSKSKDFWAVCLRENNKLIGNIYLSEREQANWEVGYVFNHAYQNKGYASESVRALINKIFTENNAHRIYAECNPENIRSWKLLERIEFRKEAHLRKNIYFNCGTDGSPLWQDTYIYGLLKEEWELV